MAAHTERMERFENAIFKQREEINHQMTKMFGLLKELTASRTLEKVLIREDTKHPITKKFNSISLIKVEEEVNVKNNKAANKSISEPEVLEVALLPKEIDNANRVEVSIVDEPVEASGSQSVGYYLKHKINEKLIKGLVENQRFNDALSATRTGELKNKDTLVDQGSDVNVMPFSIYNKLTDERPAKTDIRLSLASHLYIYPLGIAEDVLVEVAEYVYHVDFVILDIKEDEKRPFILGTPFLTTARLLILEWEERIKLHQKNEMEFDQWRSKYFNTEIPTSKAREYGIEDERGVMLYLMRRSLEVLRKFQEDDS
ncbi:MAK10-like protein [Tanacetum coccineum]